MYGDRVVIPQGYLKAVTSIDIQSFYSALYKATKYVKNYCCWENQSYLSVFMK
jgi:hypothetical protein